MDSVRNHPKIRLDAADLRILASLQEDASRSIADIADRIHLSANACWHRIKKMEDEGIIQRRVAILDPTKLGVGLTMFVMICAPEHSAAWFENFAATIRGIPAVTEFHRTSGEVDYLLKLQLPDVAAYDEVYKELLRCGRCADVSALFSMEEIKRVTAVPLPMGSHDE